MLAHDAVGWGTHEVLQWQMHDGQRSEKMLPEALTIHPIFMNYVLNMQ